MTPLEAAKQMAGKYPLPRTDPPMTGYSYGPCGDCRGDLKDHDPNCPRALMPRIVKALEAVEWFVRVCEEREPNGFELSDLVAVLNGEE